MRFVPVSLPVLLVAGLSCAPSPAVRNVPEVGPDTLARILRAEDRRVVDDPLRDALGDHSPAIRAAAMRAMGRIGAPESSDVLLRGLADPDAGVRSTAAFGLGLLGRSETVVPLTRAVSDIDPGVRARAVQALGMLAVAEGTPAVLSALADADPGVREEAALAAWRLPDPAPVLDALFRGTADSAPQVRFACAYALARLGSAPFVPPSAGPAPGRIGPSDVARVRGVLRSLVRDPAPEIRMQVARGLARPSTPAEESALGALAQDTEAGVRVQVARSLAYEGAPVEPHLVRLLRDKEPAVARAALEGLGEVRTPEVAGYLLDGLDHERRGWFLEAAISALTDAYASLAPPRLMELALEKDPRVRARVASLLSRFDDPEAEQISRGFLHDSSPSVRAAALPVVLRLEGPEGPLWTSALEDEDPGVRAALASAVGTVWRGTGAGPDTREALWPVLESAWKHASGDALPDARTAVLSSAVLDPRDARAKRLLEAGLESPDPVTRRRASELWRATYGEDRSDRVGSVSDRPLEDYRRILEWASTPRAVVVTVQRPGFAPGRFVVRLLSEETPMTAWNFARLAESGFFNGLEIHRVVPNFVAQDGDPRGDGFGGPGYAIRDEFTPRRYWAGTVGMASDGPDTAGSQWFVTLSAQPHLDGRFTPFGVVTQNFAGVAARLIPGDRIIGVTVYEGDGSEPLSSAP